MSFELEIADGFAQIAATATGGSYVTDGDLTNVAIAVVLGDLPTNPRQAVGVTPYPISDNPAGTDGVLGLQFMMRSPGLDPRPVWTMRDAIYDALSGRTMFTVNGHPVASLWRPISAPLGPDALGNYEHADTYYLNISRPATAYRTD